MNRRKVIILFVLFLFFAYTKGQDKIITTQNDTIFCKIVSISLDYIKYEQNGDNLMTGSNSIPMKQVQEYSLGSRSQETPPSLSTGQQAAKSLPAYSSEKKVTKPLLYPGYSSKKQTEESFSRWRIGIQGGGSYLLNSLAPLRQAMKDAGVSPEAQANEYYKKLRYGLSANADIYYLTSHSFGVGVRYSFFTSSVQMDYAVKDNNSDVPVFQNVNEKENFFLNYVGPSFLFQQWIDQGHKFRLNEELSAGYVFFNNKIQFDPYQYVVVNPDLNSEQNSILKKGNTFGGNFQLSLEYYPASWVSIGVSGGVFPVMFRKLQISGNNTSITKNLDDSHALDLSRVDCTLGVRFHF